MISPPSVGRSTPGPCPPTQPTHLSPLYYSGDSARYIVCMRLLSALEAHRPVSPYAATVLSFSRLYRILLSLFSAHRSRRLHDSSGLPLRIIAWLQDVCFSMRASVQAAHVPRARANRTCCSLHRQWRSSPGPSPLYCLAYLHCSVRSHCAVSCLYASCLQSRRSAPCHSLSGRPLLFCFCNSRCSSLSFVLRTRLPVDLHLYDTTRPFARVHRMCMLFSPMCLHTSGPRSFSTLLPHLSSPFR